MNMVKLGEIAKIQYGYAFKSDNFITNAIPVIRIGDITEDGLIPDYNCCYPEVYWNEHPECRLKKDAILIAMSGATVGKSCKNLSDNKYLLNQRVAAVNVNTQNVTNYIFYSIKSSAFKKYVEKASIGCAQPNISGQQISNFMIPLRTKEEQEIIALRLEKIEQIIKSHKFLIQKYDTLIKSRFIEMFGDPATNPMNWNTVNISSLLTANASNGFFAKRDEYTEDGNVEVLGVVNIVNTMYSKIDLLPKTNASEKDIKKYSVKYGDMLFCRSSLVAEGIGKASIVPENINKTILFECHVIRLRLDLNKCVPEYMQMLSTTSFFRNQVLKHAKTSTMTTIGQDGILKTDVRLPPIEKQKQFLSFIKQIDKSKFAVQKSLEKAEILYKSLMQEYFG